MIGTPAVKDKKQRMIFKESCKQSQKACVKANITQSSPFFPPMVVDT